MKNQTTKKPIYAPMAQICRNWQLSHQVGLSWFFQIAKKMQVSTVRFENVRIESDLYRALVKTCEEHHLVADFLIPGSVLNQEAILDDGLRRGVRYGVLIHKALNPDFLHALEKLGARREGLHFMMIVRRDWDYKNCFRSLPSFVRNKLSLEFPVSLSRRDPFFSPAEAKAVLDSLNGNFPMDPVIGSSDHCRLTSQGLNTNISHFSTPRKLRAERPKITLIAYDPDLLKKISVSLWLKKSPELFEILVGRVAGEKTRVVPSIRAVSTVRIWAHPVDIEVPISQACMDNYLMAKSDGDWIVFIDDNAVADFDAVVSVLMADQKDLLKLSERHRIRVFSKEDILAVGGMDPLLKNSVLGFVDLQFRLHLYHQRELDVQRLFEDFGIEEFNFIESLESQTFVSKHFNELSRVEFLDSSHRIVEENSAGKNQMEEKLHYKKEWIRDMYLSLYNATPRVAFEGNLNFLKEFLRSHRWRISIFFKFLPGRLRLLFFKVSFPLRKIYYFTHYQFEKRIMKLHQRSRELEG